MKKKFIIVLMFLFCEPCCTADHNKVIIADPEPAGVIRTSAYNLERITEAALKGGETRAKKTGNAVIIAWALKTDYLDIPPRIFEEVVVLVHCSDDKAADLWTLSYLSRLTSSAGSDRHWRLSLTSPPLVQFREYRYCPTDSDIAGFFRTTNFGHNEFDPDTKIMSVVLYQNSSGLMRSLKEGIPDREKKKRMTEYININSHPFPVFETEGN